MPHSEGDSLGPYEILSPIGAGWGVYRAKDTKLDRDVAVKVIPAAVAEAPDHWRGLSVMHSFEAPSEKEILKQPSGLSLSNR